MENHACDDSRRDTWHIIQAPPSLSIRLMRDFHDRKLQKIGAILNLATGPINSGQAASMKFSMQQLLEDRRSPDSGDIVIKACPNRLEYHRKSKR